MNGVGLHMDRMPTHDHDYGQENYLNNEDKENKSMLPIRINSN